MAEKRLKVAAAMHDAKDKRVFVFEAVNDDVFAHGKAAVSRAEIILAGTSDIGKAGKREKTVRDSVDQPVGNFDAAAFLRDVKPDVIKIGFGAWRQAMRHLAGRRGQFGEKAGASAFLHVTGKLLHGLLRDVSAFAAVYGRAGVIEREEKFGALPLAFLPQSERLLYGVLFRVEPSAFNRATGESLLTRGKVYIHRFQNTENPVARQVFSGSAVRQRGL
jgi:hypothetical protein